MRYLSMVWQVAKWFFALFRRRDGYLRIRAGGREFRLDLVGERHYAVYDDQDFQLLGHISYNRRTGMWDGRAMIQVGLSAVNDFRTVSYRKKQPCALWLWQQNKGTRRGPAK